MQIDRERPGTMSKPLTLPLDLHEASGMVDHFQHKRDDLCIRTLYISP